MPVLKDAKDPSGPIRICGDYKITVNKAAPVDSYPIPNTIDQLATLAGGEKFTKLDLSQAYQQLELDEESREFWESAFPDESQGEDRNSEGAPILLTIVTRKAD